MDWNQKVIDEFRNNNGVVGGDFSGMKLLLLTLKGAKTGSSYTKPLVYTSDGSRYVVAASKGGAPTNPDWYFNLLKHPDVTLEVGSEKFPAIAKEASVEERDRLYANHAKEYPQFSNYQQKTERKIPVFVLERVV